MNNIIIIGAGRHTNLIIDILSEDDDVKIDYILDDNKELIGSNKQGIEIYGAIDKIDEIITDRKCIISVGNNIHRENIAKSIDLQNRNYANIIAKSSVIYKSVTYGYGNMIMPNSTIESNVIIGNNNIINTSCYIGHDSTIGNFASISPMVTVGGGVSIGDNSFIGMGSIINQRVKIGKNVIIASGTLVQRDLPDNSFIIGNPGVIKTNVSHEELWKKLM